MLVHQAYCWCVLIICIFKLSTLTFDLLLDPSYPSNCWATKQINDCTVRLSAASKLLFLQLETSISKLTKTTRLDSVTRLSHMHKSHNVQMSLIWSVLSLHFLAFLQIHICIVVSLGKDISSDFQKGDHRICCFKHYQRQKEPFSCQPPCPLWPKYKYKP